MSLSGLAPIVGMLVLLELSAGTMFITLVTDLLNEVGRGFLGTTALISASVLGVGVGLEQFLPDPSLLLARPVSAGTMASMSHWTLGLLAGLVLYAFMSAVGTDVARRVVGAVTVLSGVMALVRAAQGLGVPPGGGATALMTLLPGALLCGAALGGMLLGHWYLISPGLSFRPLRRAIYAVFLALGVQTVILVIALATASAAARGEVIGQRYGVFFWLLIIGGGLVFTAAVNALTLYFARIRANQPATAMLYVVIITVLMGVVPSHLVYFASGVPV
jgi:hypothetical protein